MANLIKCPNCGENNLADMEFCQYCQTPLIGSSQPLTPGESPTKKSTAELESALPQWLKDARESARQFSDEDLQPTPQKPQEPSSTFSAPDLLAGLQSQAEEDEEDVPDWLANITGNQPKSATPQEESPETESEVPSWLSGLAPSESQPERKDELTDWLRSADEAQASQQPEPFSFEATRAGETQDWLHSMVSDDSTTFNETTEVPDEPFTPSDTPDWLRALESPTDAGDSGTPPASSDTPDWLKSLSTKSATSTPGTQPESSETPDWLKALEADNAAFTSGIEPEFSDTPDWLKPMDAESAPHAAGVQPESSETPDWLKVIGEPEKAERADSAIFSESGLGESQITPPAEGEPDWSKSPEPGVSTSDQDWLKSFQSLEAEQPATSEGPAQEQPLASDAELPSWLKAAAPQSSIFSEPPARQETSAADVFETPDWLKDFQPADATERQIPAISEESPVIPASVSESRPTAEGDSLFTEMPDWLSITDESVAPESAPEPVTDAGAVAPTDLPPWVQAMRPVDVGASQPTVLSSTDRTLETSGALAGLHGVLPAVPGFAPIRKPKPLSIKMQASEEQQQHATLLEQILSAETEPVPLESVVTFGTSRVLRWLLTILVFAALTAVLVMRTQIFPTPSGFPVEAVSAWNIVKDTVPVDGRVLVVFDYEPARAGEIEAAAHPMFDQMIRLHYPRLTFVSTNEAGLVLSERFISSGPLAELNYQTGSQYLNLGYLPGGGMGIRAFAENPFGTLRYAAPQTSNLADLKPVPAKAFPPVEGVDSFSQFSALFLLTDDADSARTWIEQTTSVRGSVPFVVVSSAQAAPMLQPYYASGQINGLVSGLYDSALFEQNNEGRSSTVRTYWDAYGVGMLLAMILILVGGLISLTLGLRDRVAMREAK